MRMVQAIDDLELRRGPDGKEHVVVVKGKMVPAGIPSKTKLKRAARTVKHKPAVKTIIGGPAAYARKVVSAR